MIEVQKGRVKPKLSLCQDVSQSHPVLIIGAGPTGLASALAISSLSLPVTIIERSSRESLISSGAGINLQEKAIECLNELGITTSSLIDHGNVILKQSYYCPNGRLVCALDKASKDPCSQNPGQISIHRGALMKLLLERVEEQKERIP